MFSVRFFVIPETTLCTKTWRIFWSSERIGQATICRKNGSLTSVLEKRFVRNSRVMACTDNTNELDKYIKGHQASLKFDNVAFLQLFRWHFRRRRVFGYGQKIRDVVQLPRHASCADIWERPQKSQGHGFDAAVDEVMSKSCAQKSCKRNSPSFLKLSRTFGRNPESSHCTTQTNKSRPMPCSLVRSRARPTGLCTKTPARSLPQTPHEVCVGRKMECARNLFCTLLIRYNNFTYDNLSVCNECDPPYSAENAISARSDLNAFYGDYPIEALGFRAHGGIDVKVTFLPVTFCLRFIRLKWYLLNSVADFVRYWCSIVNLFSP